MSTQTATIYVRSSGMTQKLFEVIVRNSRDELRAVLDNAVKHGGFIGYFTFPPEDRSKTHRTDLTPILQNCVNHNRAVGPTIHWELCSVWFPKDEHHVPEQPEIEVAWGGGHES